jgi:membrane-bound lytic murein transglycosylase D
MANQRRFFVAVIGFSLLFGPGAITSGAAEPLVHSELDLISPSASTPEGVGIPAAAAFPSPDLISVPLGEPDVMGTGSAPVDEPPAPLGEPPAPLTAPPAGPSARVETISAPESIDDGWAMAHAQGSRVSHAAIFGPIYPVVVNSQVQRFLDLYTGSRREIVSLWVSRSRHYMSMIRQVFRTRGLPEDLAYTAMIESGFKPDAVSRVGAKGMWQFMAATARRYGLRVDRWVDERLDPEKSTHAAASYLRDLHDLFGSWALAQAAYNAGEMKVSRAIQFTGSRDFYVLAQSKHLRRETKEFVPQIQAATVIGRDPSRYGFEFDHREPMAFETVSVPANTDVRKLALSAKLPPEAVQSLNKVLVRGVTPPGGPWPLRVPAGSQDSVVMALAPAKRAHLVVGATRAHSSGAEVHVVRPRDTVSTIAKRYGVSVGDVLRWNSLDRQDRIRPGDRLRVAATGDRESR